jgi:hypothetical protein
MADAATLTFFTQKALIIYDTKCSRVPSQPANCVRWWKVVKIVEGRESEINSQVHDYKSRMSDSSSALCHRQEKTMRVNE